jgi:hypothetical protein
MQLEAALFDDVASDVLHGKVLRQEWGNAGAAMARHPLRTQPPIL